MVAPTMATEDAAELALIGSHLAALADQAGLFWKYDLDDGRTVEVRAMLFGNARLCIGPTGRLVYDAGYCYVNLTMAIMAAALWIDAGATGEPIAWVKNLQTQEYRP